MPDKSQEIPQTSTKPASPESMLEIRAKIDGIMHGKKPLGKEEYNKLSAEIDAYQQNPYGGPEPEESLKKPSLLTSFRRKLHI